MSNDNTGTAAVALPGNNPYAALLAQQAPPTLTESTSLALVGDQYAGGDYMPYLKPVSSLSAEFIARKADMGDVLLVKDKNPRVILPAPPGGVNDADSDPNGPIAQVQVIAWRVRIFDMREAQKDLWKVYTDPAHPKWAELQAIGEAKGKNGVLFGPEILLAILTTASNNEEEHGRVYDTPILATVHLTGSARSMGERFAAGSIYHSPDPRQAGRVSGLAGRIAKGSQGTWGSYAITPPDELESVIESDLIIRDPLDPDLIKKALTMWENGRGEPLPA